MGVTERVAVAAEFTIISKVALERVRTGTNEESEVAAERGVDPNTPDSRAQSGHDIMERHLCDGGWRNADSQRQGR